MQEIGGFQKAVVSLLLLATASFCVAQQADKRESPVKEDQQAQPSDAQPSLPQQSAVTQPASPTEIVLAQPTAALPTAQPILEKRPAQPLQQQNNWQQHGASHLVSQRQTWAQRGGYQGFRVPHADFTSR